MGKERRGSGSHYYRKVRYGDRVVSEYVGRGEFADAAEYLDTLARQEREDERRAWRQEAEREQRLDAVVDEVVALATAAVEAVLLAAGYHKHKGQWRKQRGK